MNKPVIQQLTSYDLYKAFAVIIMVIDHIGAYFLYDNDYLWFKAVGRIGFPIWFFLIGYSRGRQIGAGLIIGALALFFGDLVFGRPLFPLNALVTIIFIRLMIDPCMRLLLKNKTFFWAGSFLFILLMPFSGSVAEYGTLALALAVFGWLVRNAGEESVQKILRGTGYRDFCLLFFVITMYVSYLFTPEQMAVITVGTGAVMWGLHRFRSKNYPMPDRLPLLWGAKICQFMGRNTLEIYVIHLLMFKATNVLLNKTSLFHFTWL